MITENGRFEIGYSIKVNAAILGSNCEYLWNIKTILKVFI